MFSNKVPILISHFDFQSRFLLLLNIVVLWHRLNVPNSADSHQNHLLNQRYLKSIRHFALSPIELMLDKKSIQVRYIPSSNLALASEHFA